MEAPPSPPIVRFYRMIEQMRLPQRADRSAAGTLPTRAYRYCEAATSATAFGWWIFPPSDVTLLWDGADIFWRLDNAEWFPLLPAAQFPGFLATFNSSVPPDLKDCAPPFLTALPEPGTLQMWCGLIARTAPGWHLLVRAPANLPGPGGYTLYEGIVASDHWFGPLFINLRFTRSHVPIKFRRDFPIAMAQPVQQRSYSNDTLSRVETVDTMAEFRAEDWQAYRSTIVVPNHNPSRPFGNYASALRRSQKRGCPASESESDHSLERLE